MTNKQLSKAEKAAQDPNWTPKNVLCFGDLKAILKDYVTFSDGSVLRLSDKKVMK